MNASLNSVKVENFVHVISQYKLEKRCIALGPLLRMKRKDRDYLLRDHEIKPVYDPSEIRTRDRLDALLHACGIIEIGICAGVLADANNFGRENLLPFLSDDVVQLYYQKRYPILLPELYNLRLIGRNDHIAGNDSYPWFARVLSLDHEFHDERLDEFLMIVDGFYIDEFDFDDLKKLVKNERVIAKALSTPQKKRTIDQCVFVGLERFLLFCSELQNVLNDPNENKDLRNLVFELYRYWFTVRGEALRKIVDRTLATLNKVAQRDELPERQAMTILFERAKGKPLISLNHKR